MSAYTENSYENALIELFTNVLGYEHVYGPDVERNLKSPVYDDILEESIRRINPGAHNRAINEALQKIRNFDNADLIKKNSVFMDYLQNGVEVSFMAAGELKSDIIFILLIMKISATIPL